MVKDADGKVIPDVAIQEMHAQLKELLQATYYGVAFLRDQPTTMWDTPIHYRAGSAPPSSAPPHRHAPSSRR